MKINLDPDKLSLGDLEDFEDLTGEGLLETFDKVGASGTLHDLSIKSLRALIWVCARLDDPTFTADDARKITLADLRDIEIEVAEPDPTPGGD